MINTVNEICILAEDYKDWKIGSIWRKDGDICTLMSPGFVCKPKGIPYPNPEMPSLKTVKYKDIEKIAYKIKIK